MEAFLIKLSIYDNITSTTLEQLRKSFLESVEWKILAKETKPICTGQNVYKTLLHYHTNSLLFTVVFAYGPFAYGAALWLFVFFVNWTYISNINQQYISLQFDSRVYNTVPIKITHTYYAGNV